MGMGVGRRSFKSSRELWLASKKGKPSANAVGAGGGNSRNVNKEGKASKSLFPFALQAIFIHL